MGDSLLSVKGLSKEYDGFEALRKVNFSLGYGETKGVMGPNGAGKSTFLKLISGEIDVSSGLVKFDGRKITNYSVEKRCRQGIAYVPQKPSPFPTLTVKDNLRGGARAGSYLPVPGNEIELDSTLELVGLDGRSEVIASELPYGEKRLLDLAMSLATRPKVLLADEPTAGVDNRSAGLISDLMIELTKSDTPAARGVEGLIFVEHDRNVLFEVADEVGFLKAGKLLAEGSPEKMKERKCVKEYLAEHGAPSGILKE